MDRESTVGSSAADWSGYIDEIVQKTVETGAVAEQIRTVYALVGQNVTQKMARQMLLDPTLAAKELEGLKHEVQRRHGVHDKLAKRVRRLCAEMQIEEPPLPGISDAGLTELAELESQLVCEKEERLDRARYIQRELGRSDEPPVDTQSCTDLEATFCQLNHAFEACCNETKAWASMLRLPEPIDPPGGLALHARVERQYKVLRKLKTMLSQSVDEARANLHELWDSMYLDLHQRNDYAGMPLSTELLVRLQAEIAQLDEIRNEPQRAKIINCIAKYVRLCKQEQELRKVDFQRVLRQAGFMRPLCLRTAVDRGEAQVVKPLEHELAKWGGERFYYDGKEIRQHLNGRKRAGLSRRKRVSCGTRRAS